MAISRFANLSSYEPTMPDFNLAAQLGAVGAKKREDEAKIIGELSALHSPAIPGTGDFDDQAAWERENVETPLQTIKEKWMKGQMSHNEVISNATAIARKMRTDPNVQRRAQAYEQYTKSYPTMLQDALQKNQYTPELDPTQNPEAFRNWRSNTHPMASLIDIYAPDEMQFKQEAWQELNKTGNYIDPETGALKEGVTMEQIQSVAPHLVNAFANNPTARKMYMIDSKRRGEPYSAEGYEQFLGNYLVNSITPAIGGRVTSATQKGTGRTPAGLDLEITPVGEVNVASDLLGHRPTYWEEVQKYSDLFVRGKKDQKDSYKAALDELKGYANKFGQQYISQNNLTEVPMDATTSINAADVANYVLRGHQGIDEVKDKVPQELMEELRGETARSGEVKVGRGADYEVINLDEKKTEQVLTGKYDNELIYQYMDRLSNQNVPGFNADEFKEELNKQYTEKYVGPAEFNAPVYNFDRFNEKTGKTEPIIIQDKLEKSLTGKLNLSMLTGWNVRPMGSIGQDYKERLDDLGKKDYEVAQDVLDNIKAGTKEGGTPINFSGFFFSPVKDSPGWWFKFSVGGKEYAGRFRGLDGQIMKEVSGVQPRFTEVVSMAADVPGGINLPNALAGKYEAKVAKDPDTQLYTASYTAADPRSGNLVEHKLGDYENKAQMVEDLWNLNTDLSQLDQLIGIPSTKSDVNVPFSKTQLNTDARDIFNDIQGINKVIVNSGFRTQEHNKEVGGVPGSLHTEGEALDIRTTDFNGANTRRWLLSAEGKDWAERNNVHIKEYPTHIHVELKGS